MGQSVIRRETVVVVRDGEPTGELDRYNEPILGPDASHNEYGCRIAPAGSTEPLEVGRSAVLTAETIYMRRDADVRADDRLRYRAIEPGAEVFVDGDPAVWPLGVVVTVKKTRG